ncbi:MAG: hypothetical protein Q4B96_07515 [Bacillota bacterium]|nr:hypothetical protein [Bacillota bacterium]
MMKKSSKAVICIILILTLILAVSAMAMAKTSSEPVAAPAADTVVFTLSHAGKTAEYTWADIKGEGRFTAHTATYAAKNAIGEQDEEDWSGVLLKDILADAEKQLGLSFDGSQYIKAVAVDGYMVAFTVAEVDDSYMVAADPVRNFDDENTYANSYVRILREAETSNIANIRCLTGIDLPVSAAATPQAQKVQLSSQKLKVNGQAVACAAYNIDGANYFMLRDIAYALKDSKACFSVDYDEQLGLVTAQSGEDYIANGNEHKQQEDSSAACVPSTHAALFNGKASTAPCYNIGGSNYFQLRALGEAFGFSVDYDASSSTMLVTTNE